MELASFERIWYLGIMKILNFMKLVYDLFGYLIRFVWLLFYPKAILAARLLAVQSQLAMCKNRIDLKKDSKPDLHLLFVFFGLSYPSFSRVGKNCPN
jgi:hypothetical protein